MKEPMSLTIRDIATIVAEAEEMGVAIGFRMAPIIKNEVAEDENEERKKEETK